ncbi:hypothetical protein [Streptomyces cinereoruber]
MTVGNSNGMQVSIFLADFANADPSGKVNAIGAGWQVVAMTETGATSPHALVVLISADPVVGEVEFQTNITLRDASGAVVQIPGAVGESHDIQARQKVRLNRPILRQFPQQDRLRSHGKIIVNMPTGLPLKAGQEYEWMFEIEGVSEARWRAPFFVVSPSQMPKPGQATEPAGGEAATSLTPEI